MFLLMLMLNILSAQEMNLEFNDWNYDTKIEIDSLNIRNIGLGIDTTLINPKSVNIHNLLIINDVEEERLNKYNLNYSSNILKINSKEVINSIKVIDLLGKTIFEDSPNNTSFEKSINLQENLTFVILTINNKTYSQKLYNINEEFYKSPSVILNVKDTWYFTPYKEKYRDTTYTFQNYQLKDTLEIDLKRERFSIVMNLDFSEIYVQSQVTDYNPSTGQDNGKDSTYKTKMTLIRSITLYEKKHKNFFFEFECSNKAKLIIYNEGYIDYNQSKYEGTNAFQILLNYDSLNIINIGRKVFDLYDGYKFTCMSEVLTLRLNKPILLKDSKTQLNNNDMYIYYEYFYEHVSGTYSNSSIQQNSTGKIDISITIQKLD